MIRDGILFGDFDSISEGLVLTHRDDTPPAEKEIKEPLAFVQGDYDFSRILGEAIRGNRATSYEFFIKENNHERRKMLEIKYENMLLNQGMDRIYDTANPGYYFVGKCTTAEVVFDTTWKQLKLTVTFDCYPYMISELEEGHDIWDKFNFELDISQKNEFEISGTDTVTLYNNGAVSVVPTLITSSEFELKKGNVIITIPEGTHKSELLRLDIGKNHIEVTGTGTIKFQFYKELI